MPPLRCLIPQQNTDGLGKALLNPTRIEVLTGQFAPENEECCCPHKESLTAPPRPTSPPRGPPPSLHPAARGGE